MLESGRVAIPVESTTSFARAQVLADDQALEEKDGLGPHDAELRDYVQNVESTIADLMGLRVNGAAAPWVREYVHLDAVSQWEIKDGLGPAHADFPKWERIRLTVFVSEDRAHLELERHDGTTEVGRDIEPGLLLSFAKWEQLRNEAHALVDRELDRLREAFEITYTGGYAGRLEREQAALPKLRMALTSTPRNRPGHDARTWKVLDRLATVVGIDRPPHETRTISGRK